MLRRKSCSLKKLVKKATYRTRYLSFEKFYVKQESLLRYDIEGYTSTSITSITAAAASIRRGFFAVYVGAERQRFVVPTSCLSHPLFKILLAKASEEFGYNQKNSLVIPCSVAAFQEVVMVTKCCSCMFDFGRFLEEFII
ncbi:unnamed protein product [Lactuca saligna]|uniref:Auxin-responsive protein n=1 Tax=Lactuca saligna TaxID=75948 RepID=A0AA36A0N1_LACSI|nr:unnamed protein product [Lactuca saligna]